MICLGAHPAQVGKHIDSRSLPSIVIAVVECSSRRGRGEAHLSCDELHVGVSKSSITPKPRKLTSWHPDAATSTRPEIHVDLPLLTALINTYANPVGSIVASLLVNFANHEEAHC